MQVLQETDPELMKTIVYDLSAIRAPLTGIGRYACELIKPRSEHTHSVTVFHNDQHYTSHDSLTLVKQFEQATVSGNLKLRNWVASIPYSRLFYRWVRQTRFKHQAATLLDQHAICHDLNYSFNPGEVAQIATIYDLSHLRYPDTHPKHRVRFLERYFKKLAQSDTKIITISESVRSELINELGLASSRIEVTPLAADVAFQPRSAAATLGVLTNYGLQHAGYILSVGTLEPRKNLATTLEAFLALPTDLQQRYPLVIIGADGWKLADLERRTDKLVRLGLIRKLGYVPQKDLPFLYAGARVFVYPSLYEGFGLPALEAMQSGCPVITSNSGALSEVCDNGGIQLDSDDYDQIASNIRRLVNDSDYRMQYSKAALLRANAFSWSTTIQKTHAIYDEL